MPQPNSPAIGGGVTEQATSAVTGDLLLRQLRWRYATKQFDPTRKIPAADWQTLEKVLVLSPSSYGLQPWQFIVVTAAEIRLQLRQASWNQSQVVDASHLVVFAIKRNFGLAQVDDFIRCAAAARGVTPDQLASYRRYIVADLIEGPRSQQVDTWATLQVYLALGNFLTSAALLGIDTCPMEGIDPGRYDRILDLPQRGLATVVACAAGYRAATDKYARLPKVRFPADQVILRIS